MAEQLDPEYLKNCADGVSFKDYPMIADDTINKVIISLLVQLNLHSFHSHMLS